MKDVMQGDSMKHTGGTILIIAAFALFSNCTYVTPNGDVAGFATATAIINSNVSSSVDAETTDGTGDDTAVVASAVSAPTFSLDSTVPYFSIQSTDLVTSESGATVHYTLDGSDPDCSSTQFTASLSLAANTATEIKAITCSADSTTSSIASAVYVLAPVTKGVHNTPNNAYGVHVHNGHAFIADWGGAEFQIADVSDPDAPAFAGQANNVGNPRNMFVSGDYAYVPMSGAGFRIYDISNPSSPNSVFSYNPPTGNGFDTYVSGNTLYFANNTEIYIYDVTTPASASQLGVYSAITGAKSIVVSGSNAFVATGGNGLEILDVSNPASVSSVGNLPTSNAVDVFVSGNYAYVADRTGGLRIVDISTPSSPTQVGVYNTSMDAYAVHVIGNYAYVADGPNGFKIFDVSTPSAPVLKSTVATGGVLARGIFVVDGYAYVANDTDGVRIFRVGPG